MQFNNPASTKNMTTLRLRKSICRLPWRCGFLFIALSLGCFGLCASPKAFEVNPPPPGGYPKGPICSPPSWNAGPDLPSVGVRSVGVYFPPNGKFYAMGGRSSDAAGSDFMHPFEYDPATNAWTTKMATYPDNQVNNMACGVLVANDMSYIYCVGGSAATQTTATARVFRYNPVTDIIETLDAQDNWPGDSSGTILPGGFALAANSPLAAGNDLYVLGGFDINVGSTNQIWEFSPHGPIGSKWHQIGNTPMGLMYAPTCTILNYIYVAGASDFQGGTVVDTTNSFSFDSFTNTIGSIAAIPRASGETRALSFNGQMLVIGGGRTAPNPSNEVDIYDPGTNTWTTGSPVPAFTTARRNFATDTDGTGHIWLAGGYDSTAVPMASMEIFCSLGASPTPTATATATPTTTPPPTPTAIPSTTPRVTPRPRPTPHPRPTP
jgi:N-acetylneuraminic acid mutarotase